MKNHMRSNSVGGAGLDHQWLVQVLQKQGDNGPGNVKNNLDLAGPSPIENPNDFISLKREDFMEIMKTIETNKIYMIQFRTIS